MCKNLQDQTRKDRNFLSNVIAEDESWVYGNDEDSRMLQRLKLNHG
jgi:hypothetical protein